MTAAVGVQILICSKILFLARSQLSSVNWQTAEKPWKA
jgi:hypothetical protein